ncbi:DNA-3-methyladenine glycosylase family protein [Eubacterium sp. CAG:156]|uniref:DNA-3-methyladenine glycosylase family protein n=1 Tax=Eubacterium sp. CAG:156 TaxID=1262880 RepID=UPI00033E1573|nr:8-oxoguanine DNA-glycosylase (Ogg) [Eubacterium sp. CAG:156]
MKITENGKNTLINELKDFDLEQTLECGQCFRFYKLDKEEYVIVAKNKMLHIKQDENQLIFYNTSKEDVEKIWTNYFDLDRDYDEIKSYLLKKDNKLESAIKENYGVRILNQDFHEVLISFIISQNKQIPQIKQIVKRISEQYGEYLGEVNGEKYYSFPNPEKLGKITEEAFREMKSGFRAPYLYDASQKLALGEINEELFANLNEEDGRELLKSIKGVGDKVANCVLLFGLGYRNAFPIDVWIKRIMEAIYFGKETSKEEIQKFASNHYGEYGGYAQQYLFCFGRNGKIGTNTDKKKKSNNKK